MNGKNSAKSHSRQLKITPILPFLPCYNYECFKREEQMGEAEDELARLLEKKLDLDSSFGHVFLNDEESIKLIRQSRIMFINRGLPGSGKSTLSKKIASVYGQQKTIICSGDDFFVDSNTGEYRFNAEKLHDAHAMAQQKAHDACQGSQSPVIVDNTNVKFWEIKPYLDIAKKFNYLVLLVEPRTPFKFDVNKLFELNKNNVPKETIRKKLHEFEVIYPFYLGWFLNANDSQNLLNSMKNMVNECLNSCESLRNDLKSSTNKQLDEHFNFMSSNLLHCTAKFIGNKELHPATYHYFRNPHLSMSIGKTFRLKIVGLSITNRTIAAVVSLDRRLTQTLWKNDLDKQQMRALMSNDAYFKEMPANQEHVLINKLNYAERAHVTLALAENEHAVQSGVDLIHTRLRMKLHECNGKRLRPIQTSHLNIYYVNDCMCLAYLREPIYVHTLFAGEY